MNRPGPGRRGPLPSEDLPSAEVLDELLQAFSIDVTDRSQFEEIDLSSPEVERLLTPTETPRPQPKVECPESAPEVEAAPGDDDDADEHLADGQVDGGDDGDGEVELEAGEVDRVDGDVDDAEVDDAEAGDVEAGDVEAGDVADGAGDAEVEAESPRPVVITDDELPDPVYVKGNLATDSSGERSTIFIDDGHSSGAETISIEAAAAATRIEPRLRDRRLAVKKAEGRKRLTWALIVVGILAVVVGGLAVLGSSLFAVDRVEVEGAVYTDEDALAAVVDDLRGTPVLRVDTDELERRLEAIPWVLDARVTTDFPDGAKIEIREREPVLTFEGADGRYRVIDDDGRVLDVLDGQPVRYLELTSAERPSLAAGQFAPRGFAAAASLVEALTRPMAARAESVDVTSDGSDLRLRLRGGTEVRFGAAEDLIVKLVRLQTVLDEHADEPLAVVDVSTDEVTIR